MGFWSRFFGHTADSYPKRKKDEKETQKRNDLKDQQENTCEEDISFGEKGKSRMEGVLGETFRDFFDEKWEEFETNYVSFHACLDHLVDATDLVRKINVLDTVVSGLKLYESYLMSSKMPSELQVEMFAKIIDVMDRGKYKSDEAEKIYSAILANENGLRDNIRSAVFPSEDYMAGMFWTFLVAASDEISDYSYIKNLLQMHGKYIITLACCIECFTEENVLYDLTKNYCGEVHDLLEKYLADK